VVNVGEVEKTATPVPVSSVSAARRYAEEGVIKNLSTPVPRPDTPLAMGRPVQLVSVPDVGVPRTGAVSVGVVSVAEVNVPFAKDPPVIVGVTKGELVNRLASVICFVMPPCTMTWTSVPAADVATGSAEIVTVAINSFLQKC
jgi:hypothetical protein